MTENRPDISLLHPFKPSETALLDWLRPHIDDSLLDDIAAAEGGAFQKQYFKALKRIHDRQTIPTPLLWMPREVLELTRWSEPEDLARNPGRIGRRGHLMRAFSCAVLLKAADNPETRDHILGENATLIQLIASVLSLGREASENALRFLCWRVMRWSFEEEAPFFLLALLLLRVALFEPDQEEASLRLLADWIIAEEARVRAVISKSQDWLLGLTFYEQRHEVWRKIAKEVLLDSSKAFSETTVTALRNIANRLVLEQG